MTFSIKRYFICWNDFSFGLYLLRKCFFFNVFALLPSIGKLLWGVCNQCLPQTENLHYKIPSNKEVWKREWLLIWLIHWFLLAPHYHKKGQIPTAKSWIFFLPLLGFYQSRKKIYQNFFSESSRLYAQVLKKVIRGSMSNIYIHWRNFTIQKPVNQTLFYVFGTF